MDIRKLIKEEVEDFTWIRDVDPMGVVFDTINEYGNTMNSQGWEYSIENNQLIYRRPGTTHNTTNQVIELKVGLSLDSEGKLEGKFPIWYKGTDGEWKEASEYLDGEQMVLTTSGVKRLMDDGKSLQEATKKVIGDFLMLFYNNWFHLYKPLDEY